MTRGRLSPKSAKHVLRSKAHRSLCSVQRGRPDLVCKSFSAQEGLLHKFHARRKILAEIWDANCGNRFPSGHSGPPVCSPKEKTGQLSASWCACRSGVFGSYVAKGSPTIFVWLTLLLAMMRTGVHQEGNMLHSLEENGGLGGLRQSQDGPSSAGVNARQCASQLSELRLQLMNLCLHCCNICVGHVWLERGYSGCGGGGGL